MHGGERGTDQSKQVQYAGSGCFKMRLIKIGHTNEVTISGTVWVLALEKWALSNSDIT